MEAVFGDWQNTLVVFEEYVASASAKSVVSAEGTATNRTRRSGAVSAPQESPNTRPRSPRATTTKDAREGDAVGDLIRFYSLNAEYGCFSNFSSHPIRLKGKTWPTSEHYFQAQKFAGTPDEEEVRQAKSPMVAARMGRSRKRPLRKDWEAVKDSIMHEAVLAKFTQNADLREALIATGDLSIIEHTENDAYWGDGGDGSGKNRLGQILMRVREELRSMPTTCDPAAGDDGRRPKPVLDKVIGQ
jgi:ribA/ribD-fused uncharacterized protein